MMPVLHVMHGFIGAGKTTFSRRLERKQRSLRLSNDDWMVALFGADPGPQDFAIRYETIDDLQWNVAERLLSFGQDVIFDHGAWSRQNRDKIRERCERIGCLVVFYNFVVNKSQLWQRVEKRNCDLPAGCLLIDRAAFEELWRRFEPMGSDEKFVSVEGGDWKVGDSFHVFTTRAYLEDVDAGGIVYHANYLKYAERARTELIAASGIRHAGIMAGGSAIIVRALSIDYLAPLRLEEEVKVETRVMTLGGASAGLEQLIHGPAGLCARLQVELVHTTGGKPARWSGELREALAASIRTGKKS